jgi:hypothetical protein
MEQKECQIRDEKETDKTCFPLSFSPAAIPCDISSVLKIVEGVKGVSFVTVPSAVLV